MSLAAILACLWFVLANVAALVPSRDNHWSRAWALIASGLPLLGWLTWVEGPVIGLIALAAGASVLRWPLVHLWRRTLGRRQT